MRKFETVDEVKSVTAHEVININTVSIDSVFWNNFFFLIPFPPLFLFP